MAEELRALSDALARAGLSGAAFAREINLRLTARGLADRMIHSTTPYHWTRSGFMPYEPIPHIAAAVLSEYLGMPVSVAELWPQHPRSAITTRTAVAGLDRLATLDDMLRALGELVALGSAGDDPVSQSGGFDLLAAVYDECRVPAARLGRPRNEKVLPSQVDLIAAHVAALRRQDDRHGGGVLSLRYITNELRSILDLVQYADYERTVGRRLMEIVSDLAQLVGWLHFDAGRYGAAERYLLLSQRVARAVDELGRAANAIGMLSYVSAFAGHGERAIQIARAAEQDCPDDPILRARTVGRVATAAAAAGDLGTFRAAAQNSQQLLADHGGDGMPSFLYYLEPEQLVAEEGQGLVALAKHATAYQDRFLDQATRLLAPISAIGARADYPRSALLHGCFLTQAHLLQGETEAAVQSARAAIDRLSVVQSIRGRSYLRRLRLAFTARKRIKVVAAFLPEFDDALTRT